jgi:hypothetical protein
MAGLDGIFLDAPMPTILLMDLSTGHEQRLADGGHPDVFWVTRSSRNRAVTPTNDGRGFPLSRWPEVVANLDSVDRRPPILELRLVHKLFDGGVSAQTPRRGSISKTGTLRQLSQATAALLAGTGNCDSFKRPCDLLI